jgi:hypothetical protein
MRTARRSSPQFRDSVLSSSFPNLRNLLRVPLLLGKKFRATLLMLDFRVHATCFTLMSCVLPHDHGALHVVKKYSAYKRNLNE